MGPQDGCGLDFHAAPGHLHHTKFVVYRESLLCYMLIWLESHAENNLKPEGLWTKSGLGCQKSHLPR